MLIWTRRTLSLASRQPAAEQRIILIRRSLDLAPKEIVLPAGNGPGGAVIAPILVVQHIPPEFSRMFAERMDSSTRLHVVEARDGDYLEPGKVLVAPGGRQMRVRKAGTNLRVEVFDGERVNGHSPSVDVLFESVAREAKDRAIGVILTGMGYDGARGLLAMRRKGARTIGQDERTSVVYGMPKVAHEIGAVERKLALPAIPTVLIELLQ